MLSGRAGRTLAAMRNRSATGAEDRVSELEGRLESYRVSRDGWTILMFVVAAMALLASVMGVGLGLRAIDESQDNVAAGGPAGTVTVEVSMGEFLFEPNRIEVPAGSELVAVVTNDGTMPHDLKLDGTVGTALLDPGESETVSLGTFDQASEAWCTVPGHREAGMELQIVVTGTSGAAAGDGEAVVASAAAGEVTIDDISRAATSLAHSATYTRYEDGEALDPVERNGPITIEARFRIVEGTAEMLPGTTMDFWTFDGGIPGPMIRARVGDTLDFFLDNPEESELPHNVDFHAVTGPGGGATALDASPGATSNLTVKLVEPGVYIYHCAFPDVPTHLSHGMYGLIVVEPEGGLPDVDHEFYVVQSDFYTTAGGGQNISALEGAGHLEFSGEHARLEEPTFVVWNGRPGSLTGDGALGAGESIQAGDTVRLFVGNGGSNLVSSFHVIGEIFDRVYVEGSFGLVNTNVQTTLVPAGGAVAVELTVDVPGDYLLVDHALFRTHKGIGGILTATGDPRPDLYDPKTFSTDARGSADHDEPARG